MNIRFLSLASCLIFTCFLAGLIGHQLQREALASGAGGPLEQILGSSKEVIGDMLFLKADAYFHGGVIDKFHEPPGSLEKEGAIGNDHEDHEDDRQEKTQDWIDEINAQVRSHEHTHLAQDKRKEMLPFFALSTELDPHNIEAILATAYWLDTDFNKTDDAIITLKKGIADNPEDWQVEDRLAVLYFNRKKDLAESERHYREALRKAQGKTLQKYEWVEMYYYLGEIYNRRSMKAEALSAYQSAFRYLAGSGVALENIVRQKIKELS